MAFIKLGSVRAFPNVQPTKDQALKPLEEAAEVFSAWQRYGADDWKDVLLDELADTIQACCNLAASLGVHDLTPHIARCEERNRRRGRYEG